MASATAAGQRYVVVGLLWFLVALGLGATGRVASWRPPMPQMVLVGLTVLLLVAFVALARLRRWLRALDLRWLVALHLTRFVGIYFLVVYYRDGALPRAFACSRRLGGHHRCDPGLRSARGGRTARAQALVGRPVEHARPHRHSLRRRHGIAARPG
jgi:hypothetical protein